VCRLTPTPPPLDSNLKMRVFLCITRRAKEGETLT